MLVILGMLSHPAELKGRLAQVRTGEGKSTIVTLLAFVHACQGKAVDIVSSSRYLARRDAEKYAPFFQAFHIDTSHICVDHPSDAHFRGQILYGTNTDFEFAWMRDQMRATQQRMLLRNGQMQPRPFNVVIVDEVDNLFIDCALNSARIGIPSPERREWVFAPILNFVNDHKEELDVAFKKDEEISSLLIPYQLVAPLRNALGQIQGNAHDLKTISDQQLLKWLRSAWEALDQLQERTAYVIKKQKVDDPFEESRLRDEIVIVDWRNTGRLNEKSRWQNGVHEFLEVKHGLRVQEGSMTSAALCHPIYFNYYQNIYGLTGTLGSKLERDEIEKTYNIDSFDAPPHRKNLRQQLAPLLVSDPSEYHRLIVQEIQAIQEQGRPILLLCETIQASIDLSKHLTTKGIFHQVLNEEQTASEDYILSKAGEARAVTVATNTAGRGTDIILNPQSRENGGMHLLFTFFPEEERVEKQGFGRSARQGQPGSCRMIIQTDKTLELLLAERTASIPRKSELRMKRISHEKKHDVLLSSFWLQLREFYNSPSDRFTLQTIEKWLRDTRSRIPAGIDLAAIEELVRTAQDSHRALTIDNQFAKTAKNLLGALAEQYWAYFFYDKLSGSDHVEHLHNQHSTTWESIFLEFGLISRRSGAKSVQNG
jgi:preprotein translocase subunit SecA